MTLAQFRLVPLDRLSAGDFENAPLWAGYYEPDDLKEIARWTGSLDQARAALEAVGWADDHYFPLPLEAVDSKWMRGKLFAASARTASGSMLAAYIGEDRDYVVTFVDDERFVLSEHTGEEERRLAAKLRVQTALPLEISQRSGQGWIQIWRLPTGVLRYGLPRAGDIGCQAVRLSEP